MSLQTPLSQQGNSSISSSISKDRAEISKLVEKIQKAELLQEMVKSNAWQDIIEPAIESMLSTNLGGLKKDGVYSVGICNKAASVEVANYQLGYARGLMDLYNGIISPIKSIDTLRGRIRDLQNKKTEPLKTQLQKGRY